MTGQRSPAGTPGLALALLPVAALVCLLALAVFLFGSDASSGPNQIALIIASGLGALVGMRTGLSWRDCQDGLQRGIELGLSAVLILLAVGMLIGTWILSGTVPTMIYYGVGLLSAQWFYPATTLICALVAVSVGSSWTVAGTLGIGFMGIAASFDLSPAVTAGAIVSGAYFGDKMSPLSDTTNLASAATGVDLFQHIRHMSWTTVPAFCLTLLAMALLARGAEATSNSAAGLRAALAAEFELGMHLLLPLGFMLILVLRRVGAFPAILLSSALGALFAALFQAPAVLGLVEGPHSLPRPLLIVKGIWVALFDGYTAATGNSDLDALLSKGGMSSMLNTVWLIVCALGFGGVLERTGILGALLERILCGVRGIGSLVSRTVIAGVGTNLLCSDQFLAIVLPGRMFRDAYTELGYSRLNLARTIEDSATLTSALIPWNTCGAYLSATLGVATLSYLPFAYFNLACPLLAVLLAWLGLGQKPMPLAHAG